MVPGCGSTRSALRMALHSNHRNRSQASLRTMRVPMRAAFFCTQCAQNGPVSAAPQLRQAEVSNRASWMGVVGAEVTDGAYRAAYGLRMVGREPLPGIVQVDDAATG